MRAGLLPAALLCLTFGLAMGFVPRGVAMLGAALLAMAAVAVAVVPLRFTTELAFAGGWACLIVVASTSYLPRGLPSWAVLALALLSGACAGAVLNREGDPLDLTLALPLLLAFLPAGWTVGRGWAIGIRVVCSWLIAVALLSALLPMAGTPGYVADHME